MQWGYFAAEILHFPPRGLHFQMTNERSGGRAAEREIEREREREIEI
jgi:hypothetical protein